MDVSGRRCRDCSGAGGFVARIKDSLRMGFTSIPK
jgi:hypothetical protein